MAEALNIRSTQYPTEDSWAYLKKKTPKEVGHPPGYRAR